MVSSSHLSFQHLVSPEGFLHDGLLYKSAILKTPPTYRLLFLFLVWTLTSSYTVVSQYKYCVLSIYPLFCGLAPLFLRTCCLDLTLSIQRTGEEAESSVIGQPAEGMICQSPGYVALSSWKGMGCKMKTSINPECQLAWDHRNMMIQDGRGLRSSLVQLSAQSRVTTELK